LASGLTKYNLSGPAWQRPPASAGRPVVLVVGQVENDASLRHGAPGVRTNLGLLQAARQDQPQAWLVYKPHPDVEAGLRARGQGEADVRHFCDEIVTRTGMQQLLPQVDSVQVMTSLAGFEALLRGLPVTVWGCPFYAGWGLTIDRHPQPGARRPLRRAELVAAVLLLYPRYISRRSGGFCTPEQALSELVQWRSAHQAGGQSLLQRWKQALWRRLLAVAARWRERRLGSRSTDPPAGPGAQPPGTQHDWPPP
jgi:capsular polysaccharide export protein